MSRQPIQQIVNRALLRHGMAEASDADLMRRFVSNRDGGAFAELVERYAALVSRVCRRVLGAGHPALDDAFQSTFITLALKAATVRTYRAPSSMAVWRRPPNRLALSFGEATRRDRRCAGPPVSCAFSVRPGRREGMVRGCRGGSGPLTREIPVGCSSLLVRRRFSGSGSASTWNEQRNALGLAEAGPRFVATTPGRARLWAACQFLPQVWLARRPFPPV